MEMVDRLTRINAFIGNDPVAAWTEADAEFRRRREEPGRRGRVSAVCERAQMRHVHRWYHQDVRRRDRVQIAKRDNVFIT